MSEERNKVGRTLRLEPDLNDRLVSLCAHLGVNPNSYLLNKVGEAISRDEVSYIATRNSDTQKEQLAAFIEMVNKSVEG